MVVDNMVAWFLKNKKNIIGFAMNAAIGGLLLSAGILFSVTQIVSEDRLLHQTTFNFTQLSEKKVSQAKRQIAESENKKISNLTVTVLYKDKKHIFTASESGVGTNVMEVLGECFNGYEQTYNVFDKLEALYAIREAATTAKVHLTIDENILKQKVHEFANSISQAAEDSIAFFDADTREFSYTDEKSGVAVEEETLYNDIKNSFLNMQSTTVTAKEKIVESKVKKQDLMKVTRLIGHYKTELNSNEDRNTNIKLMCAAFNGKMLLPGETLSTNQLVGERTAEKGFKEAPAIASGFKIVNELGGGICQSTGTLYNAVLLAGLEIADRNRHSWPSDYLPIGQDAMIDWPNKDFAFRNNTEWPVYIAARMENRSVIMEVFGAPPADGSEVVIKTDIRKVTNPKPKRYIKDTGLKQGQKIVEVAERIGYITRTTRNYYAGDKLVRSELISEDNYPAVQGEIRIGTGSGNK